MVSFSPRCRLCPPASCSSSMQLGEGVVPTPPAWRPYGLEAGTESNRKTDCLGCFFNRLPASGLPEASPGQGGQAEHIHLKCIAIYI